MGQITQGPGSLRLWSHVAALAVMVCAAFASIGSLAVLAMYAVLNLEADSAFLAKTAIKAAFFGLVSVGALYALMKRVEKGHEPPPGPRTQGKPRPIVAVAALALLAGAIAIPNLAMAPRAEPDETHHLIVARNIAEYGIYASGHPDSGVIHFDPYDSVGAPVLVPIAGAFQLGDVSVAAARYVMAFFYVLLAIAAYAFITGTFGTPAGLTGAALLLLAPMSPYLGRTLYGEVPALLFFIASLWAWRGSMSRDSALLCVIGGGLFGLSVLSKSFMVLALFPIAGAMIFGCLRSRSIDWRCAISYGMGFVIVLGVWSFYKDANALAGSATASKTLAEYQHNLMFGLEPVPQTAMYWLGMLPAVILGLAGLIYTAPRIFGANCDPPLMALWLWTVFVAFWFTFFTTGNIPRYAWYSFACGLLFAGPAVVAAFTQFLRERRRLLPACAAILLVILFARSGRDIAHLWRDKTMEEDYAAAAFVAEQPDDTRAATAFWPLTRVVNFINNEPIPLAKPNVPWDLLIACPEAQNTVPLPESAPDKRIGRYVVYMK